MPSTLWKNATTGGQWEVAANWTKGVPTSGTDVGMDLSATATITASATNDVALSLEISNLTTGALTDLLVSGSLAVGGAVTLNGGGEIDTATGGLFTTTSGIAIGNRATLSVEGTVQANAGLSVVGGGNPLATLVSINSGGTLAVGLTGSDSSLSSATMTLDSGTLLFGQGAFFTDTATTISSTGNSFIGQANGGTSGIAINNSGLITSLSGTLTINPPSPGASQGINSTTGTVSANGGAIDVATNVTDASTGAFNITNNGQLRFDGNFNASGERVDYLVGTGGTRDGTLIVNNSAHGLGTIGVNFSGPLVDDFAPSGANIETIDFRNVTFNASYSIVIGSIGGTSVLQVMDGVTRVAYVGLGSGSVTDPSTLQLVNDTFNGTEVAALCFCNGTRIATPSGHTLVERLTVGDEVMSAAGVARRVVWIGVGQVLATRGRRSAATPVIVRRGALADNVPNRDLRVTKGHALYLDGVLIPVEFLVNHRSILWDDRAQEVSLYHIELETPRRAAGQRCAGGELPRRRQSLAVPERQFRLGPAAAGSHARRC